MIEDRHGVFFVTMAFSLRILDGLLLVVNQEIRVNFRLEKSDLSNLLAVLSAGLLIELKLGDVDCMVSLHLDRLLWF